MGSCFNSSQRLIRSESNPGTLSQINTSGRASIEGNIPILLGRPACCRTSLNKNWLMEDKFSKSRRVRPSISASDCLSLILGTLLNGLPRISKRKSAGLSRAIIPTGQVVSPVFLRSSTFSLGMRETSGSWVSGLLSSSSISM
ncbi:hypothetical protein D3C73_944210 [compost metagenome]